MIALTEPIKITSPTLHTTVWLTIFVFVTLVSMACIFKVEVVARGQGKILPINRSQVVQPEVDGKIVAIHVRNGLEVRQGEVLIELDKIDAKAQLNSITAEIARLRMEYTRITTLVLGIDEGGIQTETFSRETLRAFAESANREYDFYAEQARLLSAEIDDLQATMNHIAARTIANDRAVSVTKAGIERIEAAIAIQTERLEVTQRLLGSGAFSQSAFCDVQEALTALEKERGVYLSEVDQKRSQETVLQAEQRSIITAKRNQLLKRSSAIEARLVTLENQLRIAERQVVAVQLIAPMDGVVDQLEVFTIGAVVKYGEQLLRVVPTDQSMEIEAIFANEDIGFIEIGQQTVINLDAYPSERFGFVTGVVSDIAADSTEITEGVWAFKVRITLEESKLVNGSERFSLRSGMTADVDVTIGKRRLISYFFAPIVETLQSALGEK